MSCLSNFKSDWSIYRQLGFCVKVRLYLGYDHQKTCNHVCDVSTFSGSNVIRQWRASPLPHFSTAYHMIRNVHKSLVVDQEHRNLSHIQKAYYIRSNTTGTKVYNNSRNWWRSYLLGSHRSRFSLSSSGLVLTCTCSFSVNAFKTVMCSLY